MEIIGGPLTHKKEPVKYGKIELIPCDYFCRRPRQCLPCRKLQLLEVGIENRLGSQCSVCKFLVPFGPCDPFDRFRDLRSPRVKLSLTGPEFPEPAEGGLSKAFDIGFMCLLLVEWLPDCIHRQLNADLFQKPKVGLIAC